MVEASTDVTVVIQSLTKVLVHLFGKLTPFSNLILIGKKQLIAKLQIRSRNVKLNERNKLSLSQKEKKMIEYS